MCYLTLETPAQVRRDIRKGVDLIIKISPEDYDYLVELFEQSPNPPEALISLLEKFGLDLG